MEFGSGESGAAAVKTGYYRKFSTCPRVSEEASRLQFNRKFPLVSPRDSDGGGIPHARQPLRDGSVSQST